MTRNLRYAVLALVPVLLVAGLIRLRLDAEVLDLLPAELPAVQGLHQYQHHFANARELIITLRAPDAEQAEQAAHGIADELRSLPALVSRVTWQPPWLEHPDQAAELVASLWFNQPPDIFAELTRRLAPEQVERTLHAAREQLATSMSPGDIPRFSYDPFGFTQLPSDVAGAAPSFGEGQELFSPSGGTFRILFVEAATPLANYRECDRWVRSIKEAVERAQIKSGAPPGILVNYTGRPAFVAEISRGMEHDMTVSVGGTAVIIAALFWLAHRRWKPMLWLLTLLALILLGTLALGALIFGTINVISMGFAAVLLGLAVDYAVVHYQEALAHPELSVPEVRRAIAPSIFWAAVTTISAFLVLNFGGLPGLAQLGSLVGLGVALSALVMIFFFLPPLFPERRTERPHAAPPATAHPVSTPAGARVPVLAATVVLFAVCLFELRSGLPQLDATPNALRPRNSQAYAALETMQHELKQGREPLWLIVGGKSEGDVAAKLDRIEVVLAEAVSNRILSDYKLAAPLWPRPDRQAANRATARQLSDQRERLRNAALANGFTPVAFAWTDRILDSWQRAATEPGVFWPTNEVSRWIFDKVFARSPTNFFALGLLSLPTNTAAPADIAIAGLESRLPRDQVWLSGWELMGSAILASVRGNLWKLVLPMLGLVLLSLWLAFRRLAEVLLSVGTLALSGLCLLAVMRAAGWSWNLLNLMALPLILGTGVDYSLFMQLALRRHHGDLEIARRSVGRALLLCGAAAVTGFGALGFSANAGMASLGRVCAAGIAGNMLISVFLLPSWWKKVAGTRGDADTPAAPSSLYRVQVWRLGLRLVRLLPRRVCIAIGCALADVYWLISPHRRRAVIENLSPALPNDRPATKRKARALFHQFAVKVVDLWRYEAGLPIESQLRYAAGSDHLSAALAQKRGVLLLTTHLGNWEFGGPLLTKKGVSLQVITLAEPGEQFTELRRQSRARWQIETLVVGNNPFAFVEIIRRLEAGATVALLMDRPTAATSVEVELFGRPFAASIAAAELARATGCILLPVYLPREGDAYAAHMLPPIDYERAGLRDPAARQQLTQKIIRAFEPAIREYLDQWYHFIPIWPRK